jgi:hypothetical protein
MEYIRYLLKTKSVLLFVIFLNLFTVSIATFSLFNMEYVISESSEFVFILLMILTVSIFVFGNKQPYDEWKDGINRKR